MLIPVPEAEPVVEEWRRTMDPVAKEGVPAHITLLFPFVMPEEINGDVTERLRELFAGVTPFDYHLDRVGWFGREVLFLAPEPADPFRALTVELTTAWPECRPYGGVHQEIVPHLTVADHARVRDMQRASAAIATQLPRPARAHEVWLMAGGPAHPWSTLGRFTLGSQA